MQMRISQLLAVPMILFAEECSANSSSRVPKKTKGLSVQPRIRVHLGKGRFVGPGKVELLEHINRTGSIGEAAKVMGMSYMRAWTLLKSMDDCFVEPLVHKSRGGNVRGGAKLSETGRRIISLYREMEAASLAAAGIASGGFGKLLKA